MSARDLDNSRPLDVHRWSDHPEVNSFVDDIWGRFDEKHLVWAKGGAGRKQVASNKKQLKVLLLDLYLCWSEDRKQSLGIALSRGAYKAGSRYNALHISPKMIDIVHALKDEGLIEWHKGTEGARKVTRIWPSRGLATRFGRAKFSVADIISHHNEECIVLNDKQPGDKGSKPMEYEDRDHPLIGKWRTDLQDYNDLLARTFIDIGWLEKPWIIREKWNQRERKIEKQKVRIDQNHKFVRRIFYRGSWKLGGRFHGGFWQGINEEQRKGILIDDQRTIEVDYSGMHVSLALALEGKKPSGDPYELPQVLRGYTKEEQRKVTKLLVLTAINAKNLKTAFQAFRSAQDKGSKQKTLKDKDLQRLLDHFVDKSPALESYLGADKGVELMKLDGEITAKIINRFTQKKIPILTVHDSYIVSIEHDTELIKQMDEAASEVVESRINLSYETTGPGIARAIHLQDPKDLDTYTKYLNKVGQDSDEVVRSEGYRGRLRWWKDRESRDTPCSPPP